MQDFCPAHANEHKSLKEYITHHMEIAHKIGEDWFGIIADNLFKSGIIASRDIERVARIYRNAATERQAIQRDVDQAAVMKYGELLMAVERAHHGETRHQTALRYIRETEQRANSGPAQSVAKMSI